MITLFDRYEKRSAKRTETSRWIPRRIIVWLRSKLLDQLYTYGKALENAGKAFLSIVRGMTMEELLSEERLIKETARIGRTNADETK